MLPALSLNQLRTEARHLTTHLAGLAPNTAEYAAARQRLQFIQAAIRAATDAFSNLGNNLFC